MDRETIYTQLEKHCRELGMLDIDQYALRVLADSFARYAECETILRDRGLTQVSTKTGFECARPEVSIQKECTDKILRLSSLFGITPGARKKIFLIKPQKPKNNLLEGVD